MITKAYLGDKRVLQITHNGKKLINVPKLIANFTTGTYKSNGDNKTFTDLFTFSRAGKAWLVKDVGLQEYAVDVPRFANGLLIEKASTNHAPNSIYASAATTTINVTDMWDYEFKSTNTIIPHAKNPLNYLGNMFVFSVYVIPEAVTNVRMYFSDSDGYANANKDGKRYYRNSTISQSSGYTPHVRVEGVEAHTRMAQLEAGGLPTSWIKTGANTITTRPAEFLTTKVSGTTVTGDWDNTLTLSIVNGQLVHSGYGRIRSLEIK